MANTRPQSQANLLRIPQETRDNIYSFISHVNDFRRLWVCRQLYKETRELFYANFALEIDVFADCRRPINKQSLVRHGRYGGKAALRPLKRKIPQGASFQSIHLFVSAFNCPSNPEATQCSFCLDDWCGKCGIGLFDRLHNCLRSKIDPQVVVKLYYSLGGEKDNVSQAWISKKTRMISLFASDKGLPQCQSLIIYCSAEIRTPSDMAVRIGRRDSEWTLINDMLIRTMQAGSSPKRLEIWLPECIFRPEQTEASKSSRRLNQGDEFLGLLRKFQHSAETSRVSHRQKTPAGLNVRLMVWNDQERPSQQSVPVKQLSYKKLKHYLDSEVVKQDQGLQC